MREGWRKVVPESKRLSPSFKIKPLTGPQVNLVCPSAVTWCRCCAFCDRFTSIHPLQHQGPAPSLTLQGRRLSPFHTHTHTHVALWILIKVGDRMHVDVCSCTMRPAAAIRAALIMSPISPGKERVGGLERRHGEVGGACSPIMMQLVMSVSKGKW